MILGLDHVELRVRDLESSLAFYVGRLGLKDHSLQGSMRFLGNAASPFLVLVPGREDGQGPLDHLAFQVRDVEAAKTELERRGVSIRSSRTDADGRGRSYYFEDPDGNELEIYGPFGRG